MTEQTIVKNNGHLTAAAADTAPAVNHHDEGFKRAGASGGEASVYRVSLDSYYAQILRRAHEDRDRQTLNSSQVKAAIASIDGELPLYEKAMKELKDDRIPRLQEDLNGEHEVLGDMQRNPEKFLNAKRDEARYWASLVLTVSLAFFLFLFYSSVIYSAFYRNFTPENTAVFNSILYPRAIEEAARAGLFTLLIVLLAPIGIISLSYVLEFWPFKHRYSKYMITALAFSLDFLLAFHLARKLFEARSLNSFQKIPDYTVFDALLDVNFWLVIFFGFVMYNILAMLMKMFNEERTLTGKYTATINAQKEKAARAAERLEEARAEYKQVAEMKKEKEFEKARLIDRSTAVTYKPSELREILSEFTIGWIKFVKGGGYPQNLISEIEESLVKFYGKKGIAEND